MVYNCLKNIQSILYPPVCLLCRWPVTEGALDLCADCAADLPRNRPCCRRCGLPVAIGVDACGRCQRDPPPFVSTLAPWLYQPPLDYLLHRLKYNGDLSVARSLGELFSAEIAGSGQSRPDLIVPVPLHPRRLRERGFNQALELARVLAVGKGSVLATEALRRLRDTPSQAGLDARHRRRNLRAAFRADAAVKGRRVALVDDVMTTGSTLREAAASLRRSGAVEVVVWVAARA